MSLAEQHVTEAVAREGQREGAVDRAEVVGVEARQLAAEARDQAFRGVQAPGVADLVLQRQRGVFVARPAARGRHQRAGVGEQRGLSGGLQRVAHQRVGHRRPDAAGRVAGEHHLSWPAQVVAQPLRRGRDVGLPPVVLHAWRLGVGVVVHRDLAAAVDVAGAVRQEDDVPGLRLDLLRRVVARGEGRHQAIGDVRGAHVVRRDAVRIGRAELAFTKAGLLVPAGPAALVGDRDVSCENGVRFTKNRYGEPLPQAAPDSGGSSTISHLK